MKKIGILFFSCLPLLSFSQKWSAEVFAGLSNYQGDLEERTYTLSQSRPVFGLGASYAVNKHISVRGLFSYTSLHADDKLNKDPMLVNRNLNFYNRIFDLSVVGQYFFLDREVHRFSPYAYAGLALFHHDPYTFDTLGNKFYLRPLGTEGQGLSQYPNRKMYGLTQVAIPFGAGVQFRVNDMVSLGFEFSFRKTFTDYLDDLSTTYVDRDVLLAARGAKAVELAYRGGEIKDGDPVYPEDGTIRGGADLKDWYYFTGISATFKFPTFNGTTAHGSKNIDCPKKVY